MAHTTMAGADADDSTGQRYARSLTAYSVSFDLLFEPLVEATNAVR